MNVKSPFKGDHGMDLLAICASALAAACALALLLATATAANAATYDVWSCRTASGAPVSALGWQLENWFNDDKAFSAGDSCADDGSLELNLAAAKHSFGFGAYNFTAPDGTSIVDYELLRSLEVAPEEHLFESLYRAYVHERKADGTAKDYGCASFAGDCTSAGDPDDPTSPENLTRQHADALAEISLRVECDYWYCGKPDAAFAARLRLFAAHVTLKDDNAPEVLATSGSLVAGGTVHGNALLRVGARDLGGGIASATASVDGGPPVNWSGSTSFAGCAIPYTAPRPCPAETETSFEIDTAALADGEHSVSGSVFDAAGNSTPFGPLAFTSDNTDPPVVIGQAANGSPGTNTPLLNFDRTSWIRDHGKKTKLTGKLRTTAGLPIAGARLSVSSIQLGLHDLKETSLPDVTTGADGAFAVALGKDGAQRVRVEFAPYAGAAPTASATATARTRTELTLTAAKSKLKNDQKLTLKGKLVGSGPSARGVSATIQAIVRGKWRPVGAGMVRADGSFKWSYKFVAVTGLTTFSFRAQIVKSPGWPWPTTTSGRTRVTVGV
ncbi:MAG: hypothetical protein ACRDKI_02740 [Solirubrobacterales bacterium]